MKCILVTGGAGFIGANYINTIFQHYPGIRVINLDALTYAGNLESLAEITPGQPYCFIKGDICDQALIEQLLNEHHPDAIVHFAAETHVDRSIDGPQRFVQTNVNGTFSLLEAARKWLRQSTRINNDYFRFLHVSTDEVYGSLGLTGLFSESTPYAPNSPYSASKAAADHFVRAYHQTYGLPVLTTNCSNNYGPYQFPEKLIPLMIMNALKGAELPVYGDGLQVRDWLFVEDHCRAIQLVLEKGKIGETYNIGGHNEIRNIDIVKNICTLLDQLRPRSDGKSYTMQIQHVPDRPGHDRRYAIDASKIGRELGWYPIENFSTGIFKTVTWYIDHIEWCEHITTGKYSQERLGTSL